MPKSKSKSKTIARSKPLAEPMSEITRCVSEYYNQALVDNMQEAVETAVEYLKYDLYKAIVNGIPLSDRDRIHELNAQYRKKRKVPKTKKKSKTEPESIMSPAMSQETVNKLNESFGFYVENNGKRQRDDEDDDDDEHKQKKMKIDEDEEIEQELFVQPSMPIV